MRIGANVRPPCYDRPMTHTEMLNLILANACPQDIGPVPWREDVRVFCIEAHCAEFSVFAALTSTMGTIQYEVFDMEVQ